MVVRDLLGPAGGPEEELNQYEDHVYGRYLVGMLAPKSSEIPGGELDELSTTGGDEGEEGAPDTGVPPVGTYFPSSMGMSFVVTADIREIVVDVEWGHYQRIHSPIQKKKDGVPHLCGNESQSLLSRRLFCSKTESLNPRHCITTIHS